MLLCHDLWKAYGATRVLRGVGLEVGAGEIVGLVGANGAGKSTLFRILMGFEEMDQGVREWKKSVSHVWSHVSRLQFGYVPENAELLSFLRVQEHLQAAAELKQIPRETAAKRIDAWMSRFGLQRFACYRVEECSKGTKQKVLLASALLHDPSLLLLDEPFSGLDVVAFRDFTETLRMLSSEGKSIFISAHELKTMETLANRVYLLQNGEAQGMKSENLEENCFRHLRAV